MFRRCEFWVGRSIRLPAEERRILAARNNMVKGLLIGCLQRNKDYSMHNFDPYVFCCRGRSVSCVAVGCCDDNATRPSVGVCRVIEYVQRLS
jgi:hypothetical protein